MDGLFLGVGGAQTGGSRVARQTNRGPAVSGAAQPAAGAAAACPHAREGLPEAGTGGTNRRR